MADWGRTEADEQDERYLRGIFMATFGFASLGVLIQWLVDPVDSLFSDSPAPYGAIEVLFFVIAGAVLIIGGGWLTVRWVKRRL